MIKQITPFQSLLIGFVLITLLGTILLTLPISSSQGISQPFIDALFTATSAVTTTGLVVVNTGHFYSLFGQIVILVLIQIGGLGYIIFIVLIAYILGKEPSLKTKITLQESLTGVSLGNIKKIVKSVILFTLFFESMGAILLTFCWRHEFPLSRAIYLGIFHAISAFCTAGFSLFPNSFMAYQGNIPVNLIIDLICIAGAIGFFVLYDLHDLLNKTIKGVRQRQLSVHTKLALTVSVSLMLIGTVIIFISEPSSSLWHTLLTASFQSITASTTTGFNTVNIGTMSCTSLFAMIVLMFIGASPGGTGGGIKTTTFGVWLSFLIATLQGRKDANIFKNRIPPEVINKAFAIGLMSILLVTGDILILTFTEKASFLQILFEVVSAFGTVGLSTGITPSLSCVGKIVISITMLIGRLGPLAIGFSLMGRPKPQNFQYPEGAIFVG